MATLTYKVLGQVALTATTLTDFYTVPALTQVIISTITICNRTGVSKTFRLSIAVAGAADNVKQYIAYDAFLDANAALTLTLGISLSAADVIRGYASALGVTMNVYGSEIT